MLKKQEDYMFMLAYCIQTNMPASSKCQMLFPNIVLKYKKVLSNASVPIRTKTIIFINRKFQQSLG